MIVQTGFMLKVYVIVNVTRLNVVYLVSMIMRYFIYCKHVLFTDSDVFLNHQFLIVKEIINKTFVIFLIS
jgi:hypothetical protein